MSGCVRCGFVSFFVVQFPYIIPITTTSQARVSHMQLPADSLVHIMQHLPLEHRFIFGVVSKEHLKGFHTHFASLRVFAKVIRELKERAGVQVSLIRGVGVCFLLKQVQVAKNVSTDLWKTNRISIRLAHGEITILFTMKGKDDWQRIRLFPKAYDTGQMRIATITGEYSRQYHMLPLDSMEGVFRMPWTDGD